MARFLDDLDRRLNQMSPARFVRWPVGSGGDQLSPGVADADRVLVLCSPAYFTEGPAESDWAVLSQRTSLERARGRAAPTVLPLLWEPITQRLPDVVAEADLFTSAQPHEYRSVGLALMTMQAARHRAALDRVLGNLTRWMTEGPGPGVRPAVQISPVELPSALASDDARFTREFRSTSVKANRPPNTAPTRRLRWPDGSSQRQATTAEMTTAGRRLLVIGPAGSGRSLALRSLVEQVLAGPANSPWNCRVAFHLETASGALPSLDGLVSSVAPDLVPHEPAGWAARQLRGGWALLAVDGLDRAPARLRPAAWEWLLRTAAAFPKAVFLVECNGVSVPWHRVGGVFTPVYLEPLDPAERATLTVPGRAPSQGLGSAPTDAEGPLIDDSTSWPSAAEAVRRTAARSGQLQPVRTELLRAAVTAAWRSETDTDTRHRVSDSVLRAAAGGLAVATLHLGPAAIPTSTALTALDGLRAGGPDGPVPAERLLSHLADRAGLLYSPGPGTVAFPQDAVRLFLAAEHLAAHPGTAADRILTAHAEQTGSSELGRLVADLATAQRPAADLAGLLGHGVTGRRLTAAPLPTPGTDVPRLVRADADLRLLTDEGGLAEVWCQGPVEDLEGTLPAIRGLRALVIADNSRLSAVPDLSGCPALRSLRLLNCPDLRDLEAVARSGLMFLGIDPWLEGTDLSPLARARWLRRLDLGIAGSDERAGSSASAALAGSRIEIRQYAADGRTVDPSTL